MNIEIRYFRDSDADDVSTIVLRNLREVNSKDYPSEVIEDIASCSLPEHYISHSRQQYRETFVAETEGKVVGTASLARDNRTTDEEYICLTVFVHPEYHGKGIGRALMERIEDAACGKGAKVLHVPASITALPFYRKLGYIEDATAQFNLKGHPISMTKALGEPNAKPAQQQPASRP